MWVVFTGISGIITIWQNLCNCWATSSMFGSQNVTWPYGYHCWQRRQQCGMRRTVCSYSQCLLDACNLRNLLTYCPQILCHSYMDSKMVMMWAITRIVTIAWYDLHLKCLQGISCRRLLLHSGFNREYYQVKEATPRPWIMMWHALQCPWLLITFLRENLWRKICAPRASYTIAWIALAISFGKTCSWNKIY